MKKVIIFPFLAIIKFYQNFISPLLPSTCRYTPTCSEYAKQSLVKHGLIKGSFISYAFETLFKCKEQERATTLEERQIYG